MKFRSFLFTLFMVLTFGYIAATLSQAQSGGLRRESGFIVSRGNFVELTCGGTVSANDALYLDTGGNVQRAATASQTTTLIGIANASCVSGGTTQVQISGIASVAADATVSIGDRVGAPTGTAGRVKTLASTLSSDWPTNATVTLPSGATAVTSTSANPTPTKGGTIAVSGDSGTSRVLGRALSAGTVGQTITVLLTVG